MKTKSMALVLCVLIFSMFFFGCNADNENSTAESTPQATISESKPDSSPENRKPSTPDESGAIVSEIPDHNSNSAAQGGETPSNGITLPYYIEDTYLKITAMGGYSGSFVEDSSDENVQGVFAVVIQNTSDYPLKLAKILITDTEGNEYSFKLSTLPANTSAIVMEESKAIYSPHITVDTIEASESYLDYLSLNEEYISLSVKDGNLTVKNISDTDFTAVYVRYKNFTNGNVYLGGITYSVTFNDLKSGDEATLGTSHLYLDKSAILMVEVI